MPQTKTELFTYSLRPEARLLLACARVQMDAVNAERIRSLVQEEIDWEYLMALAARHGVRPLLYQSLNGVCPAAPPQEILQKLQRQFYAISGHNVLLTQELLRLLSVLEEHGIPAIPYKGPALAVSVYGNLTLREFGDLDILVQQRDVFKAKHLLVTAGYYPDVELSDTQENARILSHWDYLLVNNKNGIVVELNWRVAKPGFFDLDLESLWLSPQLISLAGRTVASPAPEELLLMLCAHGAKHLWERVEWICDVAELLRIYQALDWDRTMVLANHLGSERILYIGLYLAHDLLGSSLPHDVWQRVVAQPRVKTLAVQVYRRVDKARYMPDFWERTRFRLNAKERVMDRVLNFLHEMTIPTLRELTVVKLPSHLFSVYYVLRPLRLFEEHVLRK